MRLVVEAEGHSALDGAPLSAVAPPALADSAREPSQTPWSCSRATHAKDRSDSILSYCSSLAEMEHVATSQILRLDSPPVMPCVAAVAPVAPPAPVVDVEVALPVAGRPEASAVAAAREGEGGGRGSSAPAAALARPREAVEEHRSSGRQRKKVRRFCEIPDAPASRWTENATADQGGGGEASTSGASPGPGPVPGTTRPSSVAKSPKKKRSSKRHLLEMAQLRGLFDGQRAYISRVLCGPKEDVGLAASPGGLLEAASELAVGCLPFLDKVHVDYILQEKGTAAFVAHTQPEPGAEGLDAEEIVLGGACVRRAHPSLFQISFICVEPESKGNQMGAALLKRLFSHVRPPAPPGALSLSLSRPRSGSHPRATHPPKCLVSLIRKKERKKPSGEEVQGLQDRRLRGQFGRRLLPQARLRARHRKRLRSRPLRHPRPLLRVPARRRAAPETKRQQGRRAPQSRAQSRLHLETGATADAGAPPGPAGRVLPGLAPPPRTLRRLYAPTLDSEVALLSGTVRL